MRVVQTFPKSFAQLQREIAALQKEADQSRQREVTDVIGRIKEAIKTYQLTASDLGLSARDGFKGSTPSRKARTRVFKSRNRSRLVQSSTEMIQATSG